MICKNCKHPDFKHEQLSAISLQLVCQAQVRHCGENLCSQMQDCNCDQYEPQHLTISFTSPFLQIEKGLHKFTDELQKAIDSLRESLKNLPEPMPGLHWVWKTRREGDMLILYDFSLVKDA